MAAAPKPGDMVELNADEVADVVEVVDDVDDVEVVDGVKVVDVDTSSLVKPGISFAKSAGGGPVKPLIKNGDVEINPDIKEIINVSNIKEESKSVSTINSIREFYKQYSFCYVIYHKELKTNPRIGEFNNYFYEHLNKNCNTGIKYTTKKVDNSFIIYPNDKEKDSLGSFKIDRDTLQIMDFNNIIPSEKGEYAESNSDILSIIQWYEGPSIILSVVNGKSYIRTTKTFFGHGNFDDSKSHSQRFHDICKESGIHLDALVEYSKTTPDITYCLHIIMDINYAPFPKKKPNTLVLSKAYIISNKSDMLSTFNTKLSQISSTELSLEETNIEHEKLNEYIKTDLSFDYVYEKDEFDMISFLVNIGFGKLFNKTTYSFDPSIPFIAQKDSMMKILSYEIKGLVVNTTSSKKYEFINPNYDYVENLRVKNLPNMMNIEFEADGSLSKHCEKKMFILFLHLIYNMKKQRSMFGNSIKKEDQFANQFYRYYDIDTIEIGGEKLGKFSYSMKNIIRTKVKEWIDFLYISYQKYVQDRTEIKREKRKNPKYFKQILYPRCFEYFDYDYIGMNKNGVKYKGKKTNLIQYIQYNIYIPNVKKDKRFVVEKIHIENFILNNVFMKYYENIILSISENKYNQVDFTFKDLHNLVMNPIKEAKFKVSKASIDDV